MSLPPEMACSAICSSKNMLTHSDQPQRHRMRTTIFTVLLMLGALASAANGQTTSQKPAFPTPIWGTSPITEPYPYVTTGRFSGPAVPASPDPLVRYRWPNPKASDGLEIYLQRPKSVTSDRTSSFANVHSLLTPRRMLRWPAREPSGSISAGRTPVGSRLTVPTARGHPDEHQRI